MEPIAETKLSQAIHKTAGNSSDSEDDDNGASLLLQKGGSFKVGKMEKGDSNKTHES